ncbi:MAG TPA: hypothetical protein VKB09_07325 [Thermomicrobiales bacterium]|nr:hypothetical protein [Thermomicrobiales bacterium]
MSAKPEHEGAPPTFLAWPEGNTGPLIGYDTTTGAERFRLPAGLLTADGQRYFAVTAGGGETPIATYEPGLGTLMERVVIDGSWDLHGVSATGAWLGLRRVPTDAELAAWQAGDDAQTELAIMDAVSSRISHEINLDGNFDIDGLSRYGESLYLLQHLPSTDALHYAIRLYDLKANLLEEAPLRDKREPDEEMFGYAWGGTATPDGQWLLTLYMNTHEGYAFIHSLNLANRYPVCIDLPSGGSDFAMLKAYSLTVALDGTRVYAANPVLGQLGLVDLASWQVVRTVSFPAVTPVPPEDRSTARSLLSSDSATLWFTAGRIVWTFDTRTEEIANSYEAPAAVAGLGLNPDGTRLLVADLDGQVTAIDLASGKVIALASA